MPLASDTFATGLADTFAYTSDCLVRVRVRVRVRVSQYSTTDYSQQLPVVVCTHTSRTRM
jgi:hypothetical protein